MIETRADAGAADQGDEDDSGAPELLLRLGPGHRGAWPWATARSTTTRSGPTPATMICRGADQAVHGLRDIAAGEEITVNYNGEPRSRKRVWFDVIENGSHKGQNGWVNGVK